MLISIIGSHGTGKTTLINQLRRQPGTDWPVFADYYRSTAKNLGYSRPRDILLEDSPNKDNTITAMTSAALGAMQQWFNTSAPDGFIDLGPPALLAHQRYWMAVCKKTVSPYLLHLCRKISDQIDGYIYLPSNHFPIEKDAMRSADPIFQQDVDQWVKRCIQELEIPEQKLLSVSSRNIGERVKEASDWLTGLALTLQA
ncbi:AAA family ATPase [Endozoicomonas lisbonensis]|uniref:Nicotinamide riboside kinase n=1 Tax=Endozoicomonas lisbonensis TaxID=3120522 RepID=A0ABV2SHP2_9GAMM